MGNNWTDKDPAPRAPPARYLADRDRRPVSSPRRRVHRLRAPCRIGGPAGRRLRTWSTSVGRDTQRPTGDTWPAQHRALDRPAMPRTGVTRVTRAAAPIRSQQSSRGTVIACWLRWARDPGSPGRSRLGGRAARRPPAIASSRSSPRIRRARRGAGSGRRNASEPPVEPRTAADGTAVTVSDQELPPLHGSDTRRQRLNGRRATC